ncbi:hypothetical protein BTO14_07720 [Polaribacter butkevichii]|uniref:P/Homo B domain-containing protein n=1 Tax=Polaribacter butkevichii TaxID=218490 RepID=A0A2P6CE03_9FLAO|nr:hypothetical protein BTO14_07720 [Polaribacter butkevichii]
MKLNFHFFITIIFCFSFFLGTAQNNLFFKLNTSRNSKQNKKDTVYSFDYKKLSTALNNTKGLNTLSKKEKNIIYFPNANGTLERFKITELSVMQNAMQKKYTAIKSYVGYGIDTPSNYLRFSLSPNKGFSGVLLASDHSVFYQPNTHLKNSFSILHSPSDEMLLPFSCKTSVKNNNLKQKGILKKNSSQKRVFTLALSVTGEYSSFHGNSLADVNAALVASLTNINAVFERDFNVSFVLAENNDAIIYLDEETDPYSDFSSEYGEELQQNLDEVIGDSNYDLGHLLSAVGIEGNANCIGCICESGKKGSAYSSSNTPTGFYFDFSLLAHEIGHQLGANHTWTAGGNEGTKVQVEPGSGSTIMGYSGLGKSSNIQLANDAYFHGISIEQIKNTLNNTSCGTTNVLNNNSNTTNTRTDLLLPIGTPFKLSALPNNQNKQTYCWEQINDNGAKTVYPNPDLKDPDAVLFRSYPPTTNSVRYFPNLTDLRFGLNSTQWEKIPNVSRSANFRLTTRENIPLEAVTTFDDIKITFDDAYGPFKIINFAEDNITIAKGSSQTIKWQVNNTNKLLGAEQLNLLLSTNGGISYDIVIAKNIPNNGAYTFNIPNITSSECRFMLEASNNNFFAINKKTIAINVALFSNCTNYESEQNLDLQIFNEDQILPFIVTHTITVPESIIISDINIGVNIAHPNIGDLKITIKSPKGTEITLKTRNSCSIEKNLITVFDDESIAFNCLKSGSNIRQKSLNDALSTFNNEDAKGDWTIELTDIGLENYAVLNSWFIELCKKEEKNVIFKDDVFKDFVVFPNPNSGNFSIKAKALHSYKKLNIDLFNINGQLIYSKYLPEVTFLNENISILRLKPGVYFLRITDSNNSYSKKIIIN